MALFFCSKTEASQSAGIKSNTLVFGCRPDGHIFLLKNDAAGSLKFRFTQILNEYKVLFIS